MPKKYLVIASKKDPAGMNIVNQLMQFRSNTSIFDIAVCEGEIIHNESLNLEKLCQYDLVIFASKHSSASEKKSLTVHAPGNFREAKLGGLPGKVSTSSGTFNKLLLQNLNKISNQHGLKDYEITMEATHHGPLINVPCVFIEIGSTISEWNNSRAGFVIAKTIKETIDNFKEDSYKEVAIGIGGPHYCPSFNKLQLNSNVAFSHIIPSYVMPITEEYIKSCISGTHEDLEFVILDWKGLGQADKRDEVIEILERNHINWKKVSDINR